jgi:hypothetical protein
MSERKLLDITGVTFDRVRAALVMLYFKPRDKLEYEQSETFVVPMQHNWENPIREGTQDTYIQYWINSDDRLTHDFTVGNVNSTMKIAHISVRFLGAQAEQWAKVFHHLTESKTWSKILMETCNAMMLPYVSPISCINVDFFGLGNTTKAFILSFKLQYDEILDFSEGSGGDPLEYLSFPAGTIRKG